MFVRSTGNSLVEKPGDQHLDRRRVARPRRAACRRPAGRPHDLSLSAMAGGEVAFNRLPLGLVEEAIVDQDFQNIAVEKPTG